MGSLKKRTNEILEQAQGKVLIIDEAYSLNDSLYGKQVLDTLVEKVQGGPSEDRAILLLGYEEQMLQMLREQNPGLARRFPKDHAFYFDDFTDSELLEILKLKVKEQGAEVTVEFMQKAIQILAQQRQNSNFGNAGSVDSLLRGALQKAAKRNTGAQGSVCLEEQDIDDPGLSRASKLSNPLDVLDGLFRMEKVKQKLEKMKKTWIVSRREGDSTPALGHFVFTGSPGKIIGKECVEFANDCSHKQHFFRLLQVQERQL